MFWLELARYSQQLQLVMLSENMSMLISMHKDMRIMKSMMQGFSTSLHNDLICMENQQTTILARDETPQTMGISLTLPAGGILNIGLPMSRLRDNVELNIRGATHGIVARIEKGLVN